MTSTLKEFKRVMPRILLTWISMTTATTILSFCGEYHSLLELLSHGSVQLLCTSALSVNQSAQMLAPIIFR